MNVRKLENAHPDSDRLTFPFAAGFVLRQCYEVVTYLHILIERTGLVKAISSREFNQDVSQAKRAARFEPVFVTDRGRPTHVIMSIEAYRRLSGETDNIVDLLAMPGLPAPQADRLPDDFWHLRMAGR